MVSEDLWEEAEEIAIEGLIFFPGNHELLYRLAAVQLKLGKSLESIDHFKEAFAESPKFIELMPIIFPQLTQTKAYKAILGLFGVDDKN
jgi:hypothetical protein